MPETGYQKHRLFHLPHLALFRTLAALMFAIVDIAGFQERVEEGMKLRVPTLDAKEGGTVTIEKVFLLAKGDTDVKLGVPYVPGATVALKIIAHGKGEKIRVFRMRRRKRFRKTRGHRQGYTDVEVLKIHAA